MLFMNEEFEDIDRLLKILTIYNDDITEYKKKIDMLVKTKTIIAKDDKFFDFGLIMSNIGLKKELMTQELGNKIKLFDIFINHLFVDICYIQSLLINVENTLFELSICTEKKFDNNMFKKKNLKIEDFKEIFSIIMGNYAIISAYLDKFLLKLNSLTDAINNEINIKKLYNTISVQYHKLLLEKEKIFHLINQTQTLYHDIAIEYLQEQDKTNHEIFLQSPKNTHKI
jgi:hypothetical protein